MRLSAQQEYGLRCIVQMARDRTSATINIVDVADREAISNAYVAKLLRILRKAGLVTSIRGVKGGYTLARPAKEITVIEILEALGDPLYPAGYCRRYSGKARDCVHVCDCGSRAVLMGLNDIVRNYLAQFSLADLILPEQELRRAVGERVEQLPSWAAGGAV